MYNPDVLRFKDCISSIMHQVERVYIVDNGSSNYEAIEESLNDGEQILEYIRNASNMGIARALNQMCEKAFADQYDWILTLDQDTVCPRNMIQKMMPYTSDSELGIICPAVFYEEWGKNTAVSEPTTSVYACMTSASLTRLTAWNDVGRFREEYFIDFVDNEFCMKLKLGGYKIIRVNSCVISHHLGKTREIRILGIRRIKCVIHSPLRYYYMTRNNAVFIKEYRAYLSVAKEKLKLLYIISQSILFSDEKCHSIKMISQGLRDARNGVLGQYL